MNKKKTDYSFNEPSHGIASLSSTFSICAGHTHKSKMLNKLSSPSAPHLVKQYGLVGMIAGATAHNTAYNSLPVSSSLIGKY